MPLAPVQTSWQDFLMDITCAQATVLFNAHQSMAAAKLLQPLWQSIEANTVSPGVGEDVILGTCALVIDIEFASKNYSRVAGMCRNSSETRTISLCHCTSGISSNIACKAHLKGKAIMLQFLYYLQSVTHLEVVIMGTPRCHERLLQTEADCHLAAVLGCLERRFDLASDDKEDGDSKVSGIDNASSIHSGEYSQQVSPGSPHLADQVQSLLSLRLLKLPFACLSFPC